MTHHLLASATWGIPSTDFLVGYLLLSLLAVIAVLVGRTSGSAPRHRIAVLSPVETGMLVSDGNAAVAALAQLRTAGVIDVDGRLVRPVTRDDRATLDWFVRSVADRIEERSTSLLRDLQAPLRQLRSGVVRIGAGAAGSKPVGVLVVAVIALTVLFLILALRTRRLTPAGRRELAAARQRHSHLHPRLKPSMRTYGAASAAYAAALFGVAGLAQLDPTLAVGAYAAQAGAMTPAFTVGGGSDGSSSCSSSGCSSSSSSSSCGGGGCGG